MQCEETSRMYVVQYRVCSTVVKCAIQCSAKRVYSLVCYIISIECVVCITVVKCSVQCTAKRVYSLVCYISNIECAVQHIVCISPMKGPASPIMRAGFNNGGEGSNVPS